MGERAQGRLVGGIEGEGSRHLVERRAAEHLRRAGVGGDLGGGLGGGLGVLDRELLAELDVAIAAEELLDGVVDARAVW